MWFIELVKAIAWPGAVVLVALGYKPELVSGVPALLRREFQLEGFGFKARVEAAAEQQQQAVAGENPAAEKLPEASTLAPDLRPAVNLIETALRKDVLTIDASKREATLIRALAQSRIESGHQFVYIRIYGSQIAGLRRLNEAGKVTVDQAREFFKPFADQYPQVYASYGFEGWLNFLKINNLVEQTGGEVLQITEYGRDFLVFLTNQRLTELKAG